LPARPGDHDRGDPGDRPPARLPSRGDVRGERRTPLGAGSGCPHLDSRHAHPAQAQRSPHRADGVLGLLVDLYSDTVTRPTPGMRRAIAEADVGDEQLREDPTVNRLQATVADLAGKEADLFLPPRPMWNQVAFAVHCRPGDEILLHETAHPMLYEAGGPAATVGTVFRPLTGPRGTFPPGQVR